MGRSATNFARHAGPIVGGTLLPFLLVLYLALKGGGYGPVVGGEVGIAIWWILLLGALIGILPASRIGRAGWATVGLLLAFTAWTGLGIGWSESAERSAEELARMAALLGVFALSLAAQTAGALRRTVGAVGAAIGIVALLGVGSRLHPDWFPASEVGEFLPGAENRLNYPVSYWNGMAALMAIGVPLLIWGASSARSLAARALAGAALPLLVLAGFLTLSRGGAVEAGVAVAVLIALSPRRLELIPPLAATVLGGGALVAGVLQRDALQDGLGTQAALSQGDEVLVLTLLVCGAAGALIAGLEADRRRGHFSIPEVSAGTARRGAAAAGVAVVVAGLALLASGGLSDRWQEFKDPSFGTEVSAERFDSASGSGRYQFWESAIEAGASEPIVGIGPGTFEYWWAREGTLPGFVRDAHSLYLEAFAELGIVGLALIIALIGGIVGIGARRALNAATDPPKQALLAAATAATAAFAVAAALDWAWEMTVLPVSFLLLAAAIVGPDGSAEKAEAEQPDPRLRLALVGLAVAALIAIGLEVGATTAIRDSQERAGAGELSAALADANRAEDLQPFAATPRLQQALIFEQAGDLVRAAAAAEAATAKEPTNWRTWLVLGRIEAERGRIQPSLTAFRRAEALNPRSLLFSE